MTVRLSPRWKKKITLSSNPTPPPTPDSNPPPPPPHQIFVCRERTREGERDSNCLLNRHGHQMGLLPSLLQTCFHHFSPFSHLPFPFRLPVSSCAPSVFSVFPILKYECALILSICLPFQSLWHLRGISGWFCARLSPSHYRGAGTFRKQSELFFFFSLSFRRILPFNPSVLCC